MEISSILPYLYSKETAAHNKAQEQFINIPLSSLKNFREFNYIARLFQALADDNSRVRHMAAKILMELTPNVQKLPQNIWASNDLKIYSSFLLNYLSLESFTKEKCLATVGAFSEFQTKRALGLLQRYLLFGKEANKASRLKQETRRIEKILLQMAGEHRNPLPTTDQQIYEVISQSIGTPDLTWEFELLFVRGEAAIHLKVAGQISSLNFPYLEKNICGFWQRKEQYVILDLSQVTHFAPEALRQLPSLIHMFSEKGALVFITSKTHPVKLQAIAHHSETIEDALKLISQIARLEEIPTTEPLSAPLDFSGTPFDPSRSAYSIVEEETDFGGSLDLSEPIELDDDFAGGLDLSDALSETIASDKLTEISPIDLGSDATIPEDGILPPMPGGPPPMSFPAMEDAKEDVTISEDDIDSLFTSDPEVAEGVSLSDTFAASPEESSFFEDVPLPPMTPIPAQEEQEGDFFDGQPTAQTQEWNFTPPPPGDGSDLEPDFFGADSSTDQTVQMSATPPGADPFGSFPTGDVIGEDDATISVAPGGGGAPQDIGSISPPSQTPMESPPSPIPPTAGPPPSKSRPKISKRMTRHRRKPQKQGLSAKETSLLFGVLIFFVIILITVIVLVSKNNKSNTPPPKPPKDLPNFKEFSLEILGGLLSFAQTILTVAAIPLAIAATIALVTALTKRLLSLKKKIWAKLEKKAKIQGVATFEMLLSKNAAKPGPTERIIAQSIALMKTFQTIIGLKFIALVNAFDAFLETITGYIHAIFHSWKMMKTIRRKLKRELSENQLQDLAEDIAISRIQISRMFAFVGFYLEEQQCSISSTKQWEKITDTTFALKIALEIRGHLDQMKRDLDLLTMEEMKSVTKRSIGDFLKSFIPNPLTLLVPWKDLFVLIFFMQYSRSEIETMYINLICQYRNTLQQLDQIYKKEKGVSQFDLLQEYHKNMSSYETRLFLEHKIIEEGEEIKDFIGINRKNTQRLIQMLCNCAQFVYPGKWRRFDLCREVKKMKQEQKIHPLYALEMEKWLTKQVQKTLQKKGFKESLEEKQLRLQEARDFRIRYKLQQKLAKQFALL